MSQELCWYLLYFNWWLTFHWPSPARVRHEVSVLYPPQMMKPFWVWSVLMSGRSGSNSHCRSLLFKLNISTLLDASPSPPVINNPWIQKINHKIWNTILPFVFASFDFAELQHSTFPRINNNATILILLVDISNEICLVPLNKNWHCRLVQLHKSNSLIWRKFTVYCAWMKLGILIKLICSN